MVKVLKAKSIEATQTIPVLFGVFNLSAFRVPFMSGILNIRQVSEWFSLVTDNPKYAKQDWTVEELFQREIDEERAHSIASTYLATHSKRPQFFNSLTVVLTPADGGKAPEFEGEVYDHKLTLGPIAISYDQQEEGKYPAGGSQGMLRWDRNKVTAVAIDGQHRLAALKKLLASEPSLASSAWISVIFLVLEPEIGFKQLGEKQVDHIKMMRSLFIDLNKHAVSVSRARNLLLDDHDPGARFVRSLFSSNLRTKPASGVVNWYDHQVGENMEMKDTIPLNLVDWHGETKSKIDKGPYVASVLSLDWVVQKITSSKQLRTQAVPVILSPDPDEEDDPYSGLSKLLKDSWPETWKNKDLGIEERIKQAKRTEQAFHLTLEDVDALSDEFKKKWSRAITRLMAGLPGYREVFAKRGHTLTPEFGQWYQALEAWQNASDTQVKLNYKNKLDQVVKVLDAERKTVDKFKKIVDEVEAIKKDNILFFLVGQRAVFLSLFSLTATGKAPNWFRDISAIEKKLGLNDFKDSWHEFSSYMLVEALWALYKKAPKCLSRDMKVKGVTGILRGLAAGTHFWGGSLIKREDPAQVDFSGKAADRGSKVILVIVFLYWWLRANADLDAKAAKSQIKDFLKSKKSGSKPFSGELFNAINEYRGKSEEDAADYGSPMGFLTRQVDPWSVELANDASAVRLNALIDVFLS